MLLESRLWTQNNFYKWTSLFRFKVFSCSLFNFSYLHYNKQVECIGRRCLSTAGFWNFWLVVWRIAPELKRGNNLKHTF